MVHILHIRVTEVLRELTAEHNNWESLYERKHYNFV
jgi:hypothetical protein